MIHTALKLIHSLAWLVFLAYWGWHALRVKSPVRNEPLWRRLLAYWLPLGVAVSLLGPGDWYIGCPLHERWLPKNLVLEAIGVALTIAGIAFAIHARRILGRNWSSEVQIKRDHELIEAGPYRHVRHPIYTGLLLALAGTALKLGDGRGVLAFVLVFASFLYKLRREEHWLLQQFGPRYAEYMRRTKALIPGVL